MNPRNPPKSAGTYIVVFREDCYDVEEWLSDHNARGACTSVFQNRWAVDAKLEHMDDLKKALLSDPRVARVYDDKGVKVK